MLDANVETWQLSNDFATEFLSNSVYAYLETHKWQQPKQ